tara:strand:- start:3663 stop:3872 length:210 start_codon:yes stop_codon:yes gene_type:complete
MKYLCKLTVENFAIKRVLLTKGKWYDINIQEEGEIFEVIGLNYPLFGEFSDYFYSVDELRELEINKVLL